MEEESDQEDEDTEHIPLNQLENNFSHPNVRSEKTESRQGYPPNAFEITPNAALNPHRSLATQSDQQLSPHIRIDTLSQNLDQLP